VNLDELIAKLLEFKEVSKSHSDVPVFLQTWPREESWEVAQGQYVENYPPLSGQRSRLVTLIIRPARGILEAQ
jgi:hypothetical protein